MKAYRMLKAPYNPFYATVGRDYRALRREALKRADHMRTCSCSLCYAKGDRVGDGKIRRPTLDEKRSLLDLKEGLEDLS